MWLQEVKNVQIFWEENMKVDVPKDSVTYA